MAPKTGESVNDSLSQSNDASSGGDQQENIWSSILKSVASSKMVPTKSLLILGDRESGKSSLIRHLKGEEDEDVYEVPVTNDSVSKSVGTSTDDASKKTFQNDLALSYTYVEVKDDEAEDTLARLGLYQLAGSQEAYQPLLRFSLNSTTLPDSLVVIVLDWARPWNFIEALQQWIKFVESGIENIKTEGSSGSKDGWTKGKVIVDEMKEALEHFVRNYDGSDAATTNGAAPSSEDDEEVVLPLGPGTLTTNLGVPLVVVCTKSDKVCEIDYKEEQFDFIQQSLRTICLKYGAALFYTTTRQPKTFANLRQYILHRLLGSYAFNIEPTFVERETVLIPAGWDSWIKIKVMGESFNCDGLLQGWDMDITGQPEVHDGADEVVSSKKIFDDVVDRVENDKPLSGPTLIEAEDEQVFFARHVETLLKANSERPPSVVGPMSAPQCSYGNFGDIPDLDVIAPAPSLPPVSTKPTPTRTKSVPPTSSPPSVQVANSNPTSPNVAITTPPTQNEVLANFFQALLTKKGNATQTSPSTGTSQVSSPTDSASSLSVNSKPPARKMVEKELANLKISNNTAVSSTAGK